ncbi:MAG TPA: metallophosphoesterase family protein [Candidatus Hydrogenedentes bacterium]|mgnify:CR=1 FL=1|nr:metallophosphoesterase family protein [Candidatus Hydrogenedentota bacterium]HPG69368.1 metallophosphoesterase family protein [Candidatus Hydrogenedentota bacterium]
MVLGVMSDTHGRRALMHRVADDLEAVHGASLIFHLGDDYTDGQELAEAGHVMRLVPGLWCPEYHDPRVENRRIEDLDGLTIACAHADKDLRLLERPAAILLVGHTHRAAIELRGRALWLNPGHLRGTSNRGEQASYATVAIDAEQVRAAIFEISGTLREERVVPRSRLAGA